MKDLFTGHHVGQSRPLRLSDDVVSTATYGGEDNCYRYTLRRVWEEGRPMVMWLMMNPSVATEHGDDRTVAKCQRYARAWGYGGLFVGNTFAYRCTDQTRLLETPDPVGPGNDAALLDMARKADLVVAAYGSPHHKGLRARGPQVVQMLQSHGIAVCALRLSAGGRPCHPLYLPADLKPFELPATSPAAADGVAGR
ncbi:MAG: DUF1643 domain-containing protein [Acetobacter okinawensis]|uniref:DUF1643 domain-containing protein n=1 Tax=Acetobacter okinawensis TaxID=1076594 RepID=UPI001BAADD8E|nr:DUF1643 domain-containing protein [Acetobacter okinawensis]MBS0990012.1 DUF1643 domain-containing protein [Acetobacter okinawensis]